MRKKKEVIPQQQRECDRLRIVELEMIVKQVEADKNHFVAKNRQLETQLIDLGNRLKQADKIAYQSQTIRNALKEWIETGKYERYD